MIAVWITSILSGICMSRSAWWRKNVDERTYAKIAKWRSNARKES